MMALVDTDYKFMCADIGGPGSASVAQTYNDSMPKTTLDFPDSESLPHDHQDVTYFFIGDDAFILRPSMMKPYCLRHGGPRCVLQWFNSPAIMTID